MQERESPSAENRVKAGFRQYRKKSSDMQDYLDTKFPSVMPDVEVEKENHADADLRRLRSKHGFTPNPLKGPTVSAPESDKRYRWGSSKAGRKS